MVNNNLHSFTPPLRGTDMSPTANWDMTLKARDIFQQQQQLRPQIYYLYLHSSIYTDDENTQATKQKNPSYFVEHRSRTQSWTTGGLKDSHWSPLAHGNRKKSMRQKKVEKVKTI